jgi:aspartate beta-hydroxylase
VLFSLLRPGAHIAPHNGYTNVRLICHLPLIVPGHCTLRVGNETRSWREGELMIFDDSIEHEASNGSSELRAILLFDVWRPEVTADERTLVSALLKSVDAFGPQRQWTD